jgi:hypothetical protein
MDSFCYIQKTACAVATSSVDITGQIGRHEPQKEKPQADRRKLLVVFRDNSVNNFTIRQHASSSAFEQRKQQHNIQT